MRAQRRRPTPHLGDLTHPRNRYKQHPPEFYALGKLYPDLLQYLVNVNDEKKTASMPWDNKHAVRELTRTLLLHDFKLQWTIPIDRLCPPLTNRLNYLHWVEDLLTMAGIPYDTPEERAIHGIDIGTGANCIYALLGACMHRWSFIATEIDEKSFLAAQANIAANQLETLVQVRRTFTNNLLTEPLEAEPSDRKFDFCMCNPPFFSDMAEADTNPDSSCTGSNNEMVFPGGEVAFISSIITDSIQLKDRIVWFTSLIGRKSSLRKLLARLRREGIHQTCTTEFMQGRTKRWGIAWTFNSGVCLDDAVKVLGKRKEGKRRNELAFEVPRFSDDNSSGCHSTAEVVRRITEFASLHQVTLQTYRSADQGDDILELQWAKPDRFEGDIEVCGDDEFYVTVTYRHGDRAEFWKCAELLKSSTVRTGRAWRRNKRQKAQTDEDQDKA